MNIKNYIIACDNTNKNCEATLNNYIVIKYLFQNAREN